MRLNFSSRQNIYFVIATFLLLINLGCKSRNSFWNDILTKQVKRDSPINQLDSALYAFMVNYHVPAISITVAKGGNIIYSKTFGLANLSTGEEASNESLFRMAGTSTAITSLAIRKLVELRQISYDSKVFGKGGILGTQYGHKPYGPLLTEITVTDLLNHTCGGWSGADDLIADADFRRLFSSKDSALSWILDETTIKDHPDSAFSFSYTGYFILGMVIEKITGISYEKWVKENILRPCGITDMKVQETSMQDTHEVNHYKDLSWPRYNGDIDENLFLSRADAAFGWIASSSDLVKLMLKFKNTDSLNPGMKSISSLSILRRPRAKPDFVPDWSSTDTSGNWWEQFDFYGTTSILVQSSRGFCWAILINTYRPAMAEYYPDIDKIINKTMEDTIIRRAKEKGR